MTDEAPTQQSEPPAAPAPEPAIPQPMTPRKALRDTWRIFLFTVAVAVLGFIMTSADQPVPLHLTELDNVEGYGPRSDAFTKFPALILLLLAGIFFSCRKEPIRSALTLTNTPFYLSVVGFAALLAVGHVVLVMAAL